MEEKCYFTIKDAGGIQRSHIEREIPSDIFNKFWSKVSKKLIKKRLTITLEIDVYADRDLSVVEVENDLRILESGVLNLGKDVTEDSRYKNRNLVR